MKVICADGVSLRVTNCNLQSRLTVNENNLSIRCVPKKTSYNLQSSLPCMTVICPDGVSVRVTLTSMMTRTTRGCNTARSIPHRVQVTHTPSTTSQGRAIFKIVHVGAGHITRTSARFIFLVS